MAKRSNKIYGEINRFCFNPFPFEENAYSNSKIKTCYVGHPLSYKIDISNTEIESKVQNSIALLPGSRKSEILLMGDLMIKAAKKLKLMNPNYQFFMPLSDSSHLGLFLKIAGRIS